MSPSARAGGHGGGPRPVGRRRVHRGLPRERLALHKASGLGLLCGSVAAHLGLRVSRAGQARGDSDPC